MKPTPAQMWLMQEYPLMQCKNRIEFQQRLQWLSEGYLRNHLENVPNPRPDEKERELYRAFKELK